MIEQSLRLTTHGPKISLDYIFENASRKPESTNPYITAFLNRVSSTPHFRNFVSDDASLRNTFNHKNLKKELTESWAVLCYIDKALGEILHLPTQNCENLKDLKVIEANQNLTLYDICSGKGITSIIIALFFPDVKVHMVDFNSSIKRQYLQLPPMCSVQYNHIDIYRSDFPDFLRLETDRDKSFGRLSCIFGLHLCGQLSSRLIEQFNDIAFPLLVVSPCCLPRRKKNTNVEETRRLVRENGWASFDIWTASLFDLIDPSMAERHVEDNPNVESEKSRFIWARRL